MGNEYKHGALSSADSIIPNHSRKTIILEDDVAGAEKWGAWRGAGGLFSDQ